MCLYLSQCDNSLKKRVWNKTKLCQSLNSTGIQTSLGQGLRILHQTVATLSICENTSSYVQPETTTLGKKRFTKEVFVLFFFFYCGTLFNPQNNILFIHDFFPLITPIAIVPTNYFCIIKVWAQESKLLLVDSTQQTWIKYLCVSHWRYRDRVVSVWEGSV